MRTIPPVDLWRAAGGAPDPTALDPNRTMPKKIAPWSSRGHIQTLVIRKRNRALRRSPISTRFSFAPLLHFLTSGGQPFEDHQSVRTSGDYTTAGLSGVKLPSTLAIPPTTYIRQCRYRSLNQPISSTRPRYGLQCPINAYGRDQAYEKLGEKTKGFTTITGRSAKTSGQSPRHTADKITSIKVCSPPGCQLRFFSLLRTVIPRANATGTPQWRGPE